MQSRYAPASVAPPDPAGGVSDWAALGI
jgi:hypothetical protein